MTVAIRTRWRPAIDLEPFDVGSALLMAILLFLIFTTFREYAISNDEGLQQHYGELIIAYYKSGFADKSVFGFGNLYLYGGLFDILAVLIAHILPFDPYEIRHVMSALSGLGGIAAAWATARMIAGPRAGLLAALALTICGVWYGGMFNHTKDVPFASAMMGASFFLLRAGRELPNPRWSDVLWFGIFLGCALGLRATGLLMIAYFLGVILLRSWTAGKGGRIDRVHHGVRCLAQFVPAFALGYLIMVASWPWASLDLLNPVRAIFAFAHFQYPIRTILAGQVYLMSEVPRWYDAEYLAIKLPLLVLIEAGLAVAWSAWSAVGTTSSSSTRSPKSLAVGGPKGRPALEIGMLAITILFPLSCQIAGHGPSFTGMRHFLFVVPPLAVLAGIGTHASLSILESQPRGIAFSAYLAVASAFVWNAITLIKLHPYEYLFYNPLVGGLEGASRRYVTDYWVDIMPVAVKDLERYIDKADPQGNLRPLRFSVGVCGERVSFEHEADRRLQWTPDWDHADFFIAPTHMNCDQVLRGKIVSTIETDGIPIGVVKDLRGISAQARWSPVEIAHDPAKSSNAVTGSHG